MQHTAFCLIVEQSRAGEMYFHLVVPLSIGAVALAMLTVSLGRNEYAAFIALMLAATSQASNPLEWGYPATYLHGPALSSGWAVANCISAYGGETALCNNQLFTSHILCPRSSCDTDDLSLLLSCTFTSRTSSLHRIVTAPHGRSVQMSLTVTVAVCLYM